MLHVFNYVGNSLELYLDVPTMFINCIYSISPYFNEEFIKFQIFCLRLTASWLELESKVVACGGFPPRIK